MTESSPAVFVSRNVVSDDYLTVGSPVSNTWARIVEPGDPTKEYGPGEVGEIQIKGPQVRFGESLINYVRLIVAIAPGFRVTRESIFFSHKRF